MSKLMSYNDFGNMYHIQKEEYLYCHNDISKKMINYVECIFDNGKFILLFLSDIYDDDMFTQHLNGIILDKNQQVEWKLNTIGTDDLFDIDNWYKARIYSEYNINSNQQSSFISLKKMNLEDIQKYKFQENFYRE